MPRLMTIQVSKWRLAKKHNVFFLDTTAKTGYGIFSPGWSLVIASRNGEISWDEYKEAYWKILVNSWMTEREKWMTFMRSEELTALACFCRYDPELKDKTHCHRFLLKDFIEKLAKQLDLPFEYYGELTDEPPPEVKET